MPGNPFSGRPLKCLRDSNDKALATIVSARTAEATHIDIRVVISQADINALDRTGNPDRPIDIIVLRPVIEVLKTEMRGDCELMWQRHFYTEVPIIGLPHATEEVVGIIERRTRGRDFEILADTNVEFLEIIVQRATSPRITIKNGAVPDNRD